MRRHALSVLAAAALCAASAGLARGQFDGRPGVVAGSGSVSVSRFPETLRVQVALFGIGDGAKEALADLKTRSEAARKRLVELGASKESLKAEAAQITTQQPGRLQKIENILARRRGKRVQKSRETIVSATITADFPLDAKDSDAMLIAAQPLQRKIREADLAGVRNAGPLTPEQEELLDQAEAEGRYDPDGEVPGDPTFLFVSRIAEEERDAALAEAFRKAKAQAAKLAKAAGGELGRLHSVAATDSSKNDADDELSFLGAFTSNVVAMHTTQTARVRKGADAEGREVIDAEASAVTFHITVTASFELKTK